MTATVVHLDGITFNTKTRDGDGVRWSMSTLDGWEPPPADSSLQGFVARPGAAVGEARYADRPITVGGLAVTPPSAYYLAREKLAAALSNLAEPRWLQVDEPTPKRVGYVRDRQRPLMTHGAGRRYFQWQARLVCPDPLKYALAESSWTVPAGDSLLVSGVGTAVTPVTVSAPSGGVVDVTNETTDQRLLTSGAVPAGAELGAGFTVPFGDPLWTLLTPPITFLDLVPGDQVIRNDGPTDVDITYTTAWL